MRDVRDTPLPSVAGDARFVPFHEVRGRSHVVVDGPVSHGTVLGLSHWPDGGTPAELAADTSAEIVTRYLDARADGPPVDLVTNNHFDEDGLLAAWLLLARPGRGALRDLAVAAGEAGDFHTWTEPQAAWCALALMAMAERHTTPFPEVLKALNSAHTHDPAGAITLALLPRVAGLLDDPERYRRLWEPRWQRVQRHIALLDSGDATIEDLPGADLAIVRADRPLARLAVHPRTGAMRVLHATREGMLSVEHRYETWVRYVSRALPVRVDLAPLLPRLQALETRPGTWRFEGVAHPQARLVFVDTAGAPAPSGIDAGRLATEIVGLVETDPAAR